MRAANPGLVELLRTVEVLGPCRRPPWVIGTHVPEDLRCRTREALIHVHEDDDGRSVLCRGRFARFATVEDAAYDDIRLMMRVADEAHITL